MVLIFLGNLAVDTGYVVNAVLDGDVYPQTKHDAFMCHYDSNMNHINSYYCQQSTMKMSSKPVCTLSNE